MLTRHVLFSIVIVCLGGRRSTRSPAEPSAPNRRFYEEVGADRNTFAVISLWGKFGGLHACGGTFPHIVPLPNIFLTLLFS